MILRRTRAALRGQRNALGRRVVGLYRGSRQARWAMASQVITSGANFATTLIIVRTLGLEAFGRYSVCFLLIMIARNFLNGVVLTPMSTIAPKLRRASTEAYRGFLAINAVMFAAGSSLLLLLSALILGSLLKAPWLPILSIPLMVANLTANGSDFLRRYHFVREAPITAFMVDAVRFSAQLGLLLLLWATRLPVSLTVGSALFATALGGLAGAVSGSLTYGRLRWSGRFSRVMWPRHLKFIKWMTPNVALEAIQGNAPLFIGTAILGETALGAVRAMQQLANILNLPFNATQEIAPSVASGAYARGGAGQLRKTLVTMTLWCAGILAAATGIIIALSHLVIERGIGMDVSIGLPIFLGYCLQNAALILWLPLRIRFLVMEKPHIATAALFVGALTGVLATLHFVEAGGPVTIPLVSTCIVLVSAFFHWSFGSATAGLRPTRMAKP